ncbi:MAG: hypothetical protein Q8L48_24280 [Archangium sp.]|nr:hypothetical protein [Archangium sp.]
MKRTVLVVALTLLGCEAPGVFPGGDKRQNTQSGRIEGQVIVSTATRGRIVLFLYDAARPPPPSGTGRPLTFTVVSRESVFGAALENDTGPFTAPFAFSLVAPGRYLIRGFVDSNDDFIPWYGVTADATQGDVGGGAIDPVTRATRVVEVGTDEAGQPIPALDVPVSFSDAAKVPLDRPIFSVIGGMDSVTLTGNQPKVIELQATVINEGVMNQPTPAFMVRFLDDNLDGVPDDANADGVPEVWPRVVVRKLPLEKSPLLDENDLDKNGIVDAEGEDYEHANAEKDGKPDVVVLAAGFDVTEYAASLVDAMGRVKATPTIVPKLRLVLQPRAFDVSAPTSPQLLRGVPVGRYAITVIQLTGQTWRVPNELGLDVPGLPLIASQSFVVQVQ